MKSNNPFYVDLSTYTPSETISFYENVFGWKYHKEDDYYVAYKSNNTIVGLYETPEKFKQMRMPHFWMTYIQVNDVDKTVQLAKENGAIIEFSYPINKNQKIALIRDVQGAGFTIYEGDDLKNTRTTNKPNTLIWNELHISNMEKIIPFYQAIFNWEFKQINNNTNQVFNHKGEYILDIHNISNEKKGKYEYWISTFGVKNVLKTKEGILKNNGTIILDEGNRILCTDNSKQAFFYIQEI